MVRVGFIGCGNNGRGHFRALQQIEGAEIKALYDVNPEAPKNWLDELDEGIERPRIITKLDDLWDHVDAVWVTSPPGFHYEHSVQALRAGKHVFCEKPIALEIPHADEMVGIAREKGLTYFVGYCLRFQPSFTQFAEIAAGGKIGELSSLWCTRISSPAYTAGHWRADIAMSGGMMIETFTHNVDWMRLVAGEVKEVFMKEKTVTPTVNFEDHALGVIEFENGAIGEFFSSWSSGLSRYEWGIVGSEGAASLVDRENILVSYRNGEKEKLPVEKTNMVLLEDEHFIRAIAEGTPLRFTAADSARTLETHVALKLSARDGRPVSLPLADRSLGIPEFAVTRRQTA